jgi:hypothetical protein
MGREQKGKHRPYLEELDKKNTLYIIIFFIFWLINFLSSSLCYSWRHAEIKTVTSFIFFSFDYLPFIVHLLKQKLNYI